MATTDNGGVTVPNEYKTPEGMRTLANYLRSQIRVKSGIEHEKRVEYFKGPSFNLYAVFFSYRKE